MHHFYNQKPKTENHILYGDEHGGGGHLHGLGKPCKSEFPANWDSQKILDTTKTIAANDNLDWRKEESGYRVAITTQDGLNIRVVENGKTREIVTAYPTNVPRNLGPANDNNP